MMLKTEIAGSIVGRPNKRFGDIRVNPSKFVLRLEWCLQLSVKPKYRGNFDPPPSPRYKRTVTQIEYGLGEIFESDFNRFASGREVAVNAICPKIWFHNLK